MGGRFHKMSERFRRSSKSSIAGRGFAGASRTYERAPSRGVRGDGRTHVRCKAPIEDSELVARSAAVGLFAQSNRWYLIRFRPRLGRASCTTNAFAIGFFVDQQDVNPLPTQEHYTFRAENPPH